MIRETLPIVYQDEHFVAVHKPSGLLVHRTVLDFHERRYALLRLEPATGRRHQLRRHLKHISHPIVGDATYGKGRHNRLFQELFGCRRLLLACVELRLRHPVSGERCDRG